MGCKSELNIFPWVMHHKCEATDVANILGILLINYQIYLSFFQQNYCTPPKCGELSGYTDTAHTEVRDLSSRYMNPSDVYDATPSSFLHYL